MKLSGGRLALAACVLLATIGCDQAGKHLARASLPASEAVPAGRLLTLFLTENTGGFLSWGSGLSSSARFWVLTVGAAVGLLVAAACLFAASTSAWRTLVPGALVTGGGLSNLLDRAVNGGRVTDFLVLHVGPLHTGVFNIADLAITAGAVILGIELVKKPRSPSRFRAFVDSRAGIARWAGRPRNRNRPNP